MVLDTPSPLIVGIPLLGFIFSTITTYADDIILISGLVTVLQKMLNICVSYGNMLDIVFSAKKIAFA